MFIPKVIKRLVVLVGFAVIYNNERRRNLFLRPTEVRRWGGGEGASKPKKKSFELIG